MEISVGLPNTLVGAGAAIVDWARRAAARGFASVATIDRIAYPSCDALTTLAVAAGATSRIGLVTGVLLTPLYPPVWLAKATASLDALSSGRLTLGLGVGERSEDFAAMDRPRDRRGRLADEALDLLHRAWAGEPVTGEPRIAAVVYFGLSDADASRAALRSYYGFLGPQAGMVADGAIRSAHAAKGTVRALAEVGVTEIIFEPTVASVDEVDRLADAVL